MLNRVIVTTLLALAAGAAIAASSQQVVLDVKGMDCAACPITVKTVLKKLPGVEDVKVDAKRNTAQVRFDSVKVSPDKIVQAVTDAGFPATARK